MKKKNNKKVNKNKKLVNDVKESKDSVSKKIEDTEKEPVSEKTEVIEITPDLKKDDVKEDLCDKNEVNIKKNKNSKIFLIVLVSSLILSLLIVLYFLIFRNTFSFKYDESSYDVDVFSDFSTPIVSACYGNRIKCKNIDVSIDSGVDTSKVGNYKIIYTAKYNNKSKNFIVGVNVVDREAPVIDVASDSLSVCPNAAEFNIDYNAHDNYDGDLTPNVSKSVNDNILTLSVSDSSNNVGSKNINIVREDLEGPIISINGNSTMYLPIGSSFNDAGASASDNCDGDLTSNISISGGVDTSKAGNNSVTYTVSDLSGNSSSVTRNVYVYAPNGNGDRVVYLTFDDGPSAYTGELLDILAKYNVKATFFVTNRNPNYNYFIKRAYDEGHTIALHTSSHNYGQIYSSVDAYFNDLNAINETVKNITGSYSYLLRFPGGSSNTVSRNYSIGIMSTLSNMVTERGYKYFDWNVSSSDADGRNHPPSDYANNIINGISSKSMSIVLQHDTNINSIRSVSSVIEYGLAHGYSFRALDMSSPVVHHGINN